MALREIDGGPNYFAQFSNSLPTDPSFFPISAWLEGVQTQNDVALDKAAGLNLYTGITANSNFSLVQSNGMYVIAQQDELGTNQTVINSPATAGWLLYDEIDMQLGPGQGYTMLDNIIASLPNDGRFTYNNFGKGVLFWETDAEAARFVNSVDVVSADAYWFTDPNIDAGSEGGSLLNNGQSLTVAQTQLAANYGYTIDRLRELDATDGVIHPVWGFVEVGWPWTETAAQGARQILPGEIKAAVWHEIIAGARGIIYFNHSFGGPEQTQNVLRDPYYAAQLAAVTQTDALIKQLAPVLNSPFDDGFVTVNSSVRAMAKYYGGEHYVFAGSTVNGADTGTDTFTLAGVTSGTAVVIGENRTIAITNGQFSDNFADGNAIHIYQISTSVGGVLAGSISINDVTISEGNSGTKVATFTVTRSGGTAAFDVNYATSNGSATVADGDYVAASNVLHFGANQNTQTISVTINGDTKVEGDETFNVGLTNATNGATISDNQGVGTITNDDSTSTPNDAPTDIRWNGVAPGISALPAAGAVIANLATADPDSSSWTYSLQQGSSVGFAVTAAGVVTRTGSAMATNTTYTLIVRSTDSSGAFRDETFNIRTNGDTSTNLAAFATANDDIVYGDDGNDTLAGSAGNDTLFGQDENDMLDGGAGDDLLNGGVGDSDTASYASASGGVTVSLALAGQQNTIGAGLDTLVSMENLTGSGFADTLTGDGNANVLIGGGGNDAVNGGGGTDTAAFAGGFANYSFSLNGSGNVIVIDTRAGSPDGADTLNSIEQVQFNGQTLALRAGTNTGSTMTFNSGADLMLGFRGNDTLNSGDGDDVLIGGAGKDALNGGNGNDTAAFSGPIANYRFSLNGAGNLVVTDNRSRSPDGADTLTGIEMVQFGAQGLNLQIGNNSGSTHTGGTGADLLLGFGGNDTLDGDGGADILFGGLGNDVFDFNAIGDSGVGAASRDVILDFVSGADDLNFNAIDANTAVTGNQDFTLTAGGGTGAFTGAGQIRHVQIDTDGDSVLDSTLIQGNVNSGLIADFEILLQNYTGPIAGGDFFF
ncbi:hypothetical protein G5V57_31390 [Nordella sp. HKS 07]|uniref:beta strand repeat-containing protein n=1 Tax=Nordella sp. HKS 07 TaxID=2712222 RepID=UPI0013E20678|nr:Calx-beta domain-containing protein [Nordella sp. HKS 07]QIG51818.1 hypothetical protein G5V57_31390 [Nordella sp. HKS 07]